jgi:hypothetical protein
MKNIEVLTLTFIPNIYNRVGTFPLLPRVKCRRILYLRLALQQESQRALPPSSISTVETKLDAAKHDELTSKTFITRNRFIGHAWHRGDLLLKANRHRSYACRPKVGRSLRPLQRPPGPSQGHLREQLRLQHYYTALK